MDVAIQQSLNATKNIQVDRSSGQKTAKYGIVRIGVAFLMCPCLSLDYYRTTFCQKLFDVPSVEWILSLMSIDLWRFRLYRSQISFVERCSNYRCCPCVEVICMYVDQRSSYRTLENFFRKSNRNENISRFFHW